MVACHTYDTRQTPNFWTRKAGPKKTLYSIVLLLLLVISSLKIPQAFLVHSRAQRNFAYTFVLIFPADLPSQIFKLVSN